MTNDNANAVERDARGVPTAFRIFKAGANDTVYGTHTFTERSAALVLEQAKRAGTRFSIDVNHLSLKPDAPLENQRAVGWFDVEVRDGELWAVNVVWSFDVAEAIRKGEWRYHSPAFDIEPTTREIVGLTNLAITNMPATFGAVSIAASRTGAGLASLDTEALRLLAVEGKPDARVEATRVLASRKESLSGDPRIEMMRRNFKIGGAQRPLIRNEGCHQVFEALTPEEARAHLERMQKQGR